jgi:hypothetical protein
MRRRQFLGTSALAAFLPSAAATAAPEATPAEEHPTEEVFPYRAWAFCVYSYDWELLERYVDAALERAAEYGINTFELHDYHIGSRGLVDAAVEYKYFPKLAVRDELTYRKEHCTREKKREDYERLQRMVRKIKAHGLKLNVWYHVMRDAPAELFTEYPEIRDVDTGFFWTYLDGLFREFFERLPEVDRVTITSLHETPSVLNNSGRLSREDRLLRLYRTLHSACQRSGKELIIRDFIVQSEDFTTFWNILNQLPPDIYVMTKDILADWIHTDMTPNPFLARYSGRKVIVEFDLYGEYWGRLDIPACYPEYIHRQLRTVKAFGVQGAVGRVIHEDQRSRTFQTIFESPNEVNCYAFGRILSHPMPWLAPNTFTDPREKLGRWGWDLDAFDKSIWTDWASRRYGAEAAVPVIRALERTNRILSLTIDAGGRGFQAHSYVPGAVSTAFLWEPFCERVRKLGMEFLRDEKRQALQMAQESLEDIRAARPRMKAHDADQLIGAFEGEKLIIRSYAGVLEGYYQVFLHQKKSNTAGLKAASGDLHTLAGEIEHARGEAFFGHLPATLTAFAEWVEAGKPPSRSTGS